jgi:hypothetical protein
MCLVLFAGCVAIAPFGRRRFDALSCSLERRGRRSLWAPALDALSCSLERRGRRSFGAPACLVRSDSPRLLRNWRGCQLVVTDWHGAPAFLAGCGTRSARHAAPLFRDGRMMHTAYCKLNARLTSATVGWCVHCVARPKRPSGSELRGLRSREGGTSCDHRRRVLAPPSDVGGARAEPGAARASAQQGPEEAQGRA